MIHRILTLVLLGFAINLIAQSESEIINDAQSFLDNHTTAEGINYQSISSEQSEWDRLMRLVRDIEGPNRERSLALNCLGYNMHVIDKVLKNYPLQSVQQIKDFFDSDIEIAGTTTTLNQLEKSLLEKYNHGSIHYLLVCGAQSCPSLPDHTKISSEQSQLDSVYNSILEQGKFAFIDRFNEQLVLSKIFEWYTEDFGGIEAIRSQLAFITRQSLDDYKVKFDTYDWALNDVNNGIQTRFIPSRLLTKGEIQFQIFSNYYTQSEPSLTPNARVNFWSNIITVIFGSNKNLNWGLFGRVRSVSVNPANGIRNYFSGYTINNQNISPLNGVSTYERFGLTALGPQIRYRPKLDTKGNNLFVHTITFPIGNALEGDNLNGYIDWNGISLFNQWFYDYDIKPKRNIFLDIGFNIENIDSRFFQKEGGFVYISTPVTAIYSAYPQPGLTFYALAGAAPRIWMTRTDTINIGFDPFGQIGGGMKYFISDTVEIECLLTQFFGGNLSRNAQTINFGIRYTY